ncbi:hypothetical protein UREOM_1690 [Ureaplasma sp. OM1]|uniref:DNA methylase N-4/N-6 domain-containing protein n=1 Tax=Ureaplasma ceti TaxID=3119530 RepID=A0ABP9U528_9BACT
MVALLAHRIKLGFVFDEAPIVRSEDTISVLTKDEQLSFSGKADSPRHKLIIGDNYDALNNLLITHRGQIDVIYIDPPYNTGGDNLGYVDKFSKNAWLNMMKERLVLAHKLLSEDGVIFISLDDNMQAYFKVLMDEIFGEENFVTSFPRVTVKGGKTQTNLCSNNYDLIICFAKNINCCSFNKIVVEDEAFKYKDEHFNKRGYFHNKQTLDSNSLGYVKSLDFPITFKGKIYYPGGYDNFIKRQNNDISSDNEWRWTWSEELVNFAIKNDFLISKNDRLWPKKYLNAKIIQDKNSDEKYTILFESRFKPYSNLHFLQNEFSNPNGKRDLDVLNMEGKFKNPKPIDLIKTLINLNTNKCIKILDFFAGSGTTGQAVLELNKEDGGSREFILCTREFDGKYNENNIAIDVTYERLYRINNGEGTDRSNDFEWLKKNEPFHNSLDVYRVKDVNIGVHQSKTLEELVDINVYKDINPNLAINDNNKVNLLYPLLNHLGVK